MQNEMGLGILQNIILLTTAETNPKVWETFESQWLCLCFGKIDYFKRKIGHKYLNNIYGEETTGNDYTFQGL